MQYFSYLNYDEKNSLRLLYFKTFILFFVKKDLDVYENQNI